MTAAHEQKGGKEHLEFNGDPGSGPGKKGYIHVHYVQGYVLRQKKNNERTRES